MKRTRSSICGAVLLALAALPLPGCARGPAALGSVLVLALSVGASVGSYFLIKELQ